MPVSRPKLTCASADFVGPRVAEGIHGGAVPSTSIHDRDSLLSAMGLYGVVELRDSPADVLLTLPLMAVLPSPNRS